MRPEPSGASLRRHKAARAQGSTGKAGHAQASFAFVGPASVLDGLASHEPVVITDAILGRFAVGN